LIERVKFVLLRGSAPVQRVLSLNATAGLSAPPASRHRYSDVRQTAAKVGADVMVDEWIGARVAVGETMAENAEYGVEAVVRLQPEVCYEKVRVHRQPTDSKHDDDC